ncbi:MAG: type I restriction endonuclease [Candidatus Latescibacterota bacterium]
MTAPNTTEKAFEQAIEDALLAAGYARRRSEDYDRALCLDPGAVLDFVYATQPREWEKYRKQHGEGAKQKLFHRIASEVKARGTLDVLRAGVKSNGCRFRLAYFRPNSGLNPDLEKLYQGNRLTVVRQLHYSEQNDRSLDLVVLLNGLPIFTAELKNPFSGQTAEDAVRQYRTDRHPREPLFAFGRCLAHFAVDPEFVFVSTHLQGRRTRFLPLNQGREGGAGNPPTWRGFSTAYLWEGIWARDSVLELVQHFLHVVDELDDKGRKTGRRLLIFPRYHQLDAVRRLVADARGKGVGQRYLVQHSAGSGKSNSIAWLAHRLAVLHDDGDRRVFDSVIVVTDRRVLDRQLQRTVRQFERTLGVVQPIDQTAQQLKEALEHGKDIIVTTLQKFPVIVDSVKALPGHRFAVVIDEAHSSQSGEATTKLKKVLETGNLAEAEAAEAQAEERAAEDNVEDRVVAAMKARRWPKNVSTFAFTATPKPRTLELFGVRQEDGSFAPFSLYSMRQAIEEGFILDVLENYTTCRSYWRLQKAVADDPKFERRKAQSVLRHFVELSDHAIGAKVAVIVEHFAEHVRHRIDGQAKAMVVTRSRLHAVRYRLAIDHYLCEKGYPFRTLVAFSGTVRDGGMDYTEPGMNGFPEAQTADTFRQSDYRLLVVASKFQTGFDEPLLHTMYVDKKLGGVGAVQTLSRLNRVIPGRKSETAVLDFANEAEAIREAFQPYYESTLLSESTDPDLLHDLERRLDDYALFSHQEVAAFAALYFGGPPATQDRLYRALAPVVGRFEQAAEDAQAEFRKTLNDYVRLYAFLSQVITFEDPELEQLHVFGRLLLRVLPMSRKKLPVEVQQAVNLPSYEVRQTGSSRIRLPRGTGVLEPQKPKEPWGPSADEREVLSRIIRELNERFGTAFREADLVFIEELETRLDAAPALEGSLRINSLDNVRLTFDNLANDVLQDMMDANFQLYQRVTDDADFGRFFLGLLFERFLERKRRTAGEDALPEGTATGTVSPGTAPAASRILPLDDARVARERFRALLPVYTLKAAAGYFGSGEDVEPEGWVEAAGTARVDERLFVAHAVGRSMEPRIHDGDLLVFRRGPAGTRQGMIVLAQYRGPADPETGGSFTVKCYSSEKAADGHGGWRHTRITLSPLNPEFDAIEVRPEDQDAFRVVAEFVGVLTAGTAG